MFWLENDILLIKCLYLDSLDVVNLKCKIFFNYYLFFSIWLFLSFGKMVENVLFFNMISVLKWMLEKKICIKKDMIKKVWNFYIYVMVLMYKCRFFFF